MHGQENRCAHPLPQSRFHKFMAGLPDGGLSSYRTNDGRTVWAGGSTSPEEQIRKLSALGSIGPFVSAIAATVSSKPTPKNGNGLLQREASCDQYPFVRRRTGAPRRQVDGRDLLALQERDLRNIRGADVALISQDPASALNPVITAGDQIVFAVLLARNAFGGSIPSMRPRVNLSMK